MTVYVPPKRGIPTVRPIKAGLPVSGTDWQRYGTEHNWLVGKNRQLVPTFKPDHGQLSGGGYVNGAPQWTSYTYGLWLEPTYAAIERRWSITMRDASRARFSTSTGSVTDFGFSGGSFPSSSDIVPLQAPTPAVIREVLASQSSTGASIDIELESSDDFYVDAIACHEVPRFRVGDNANELGADIAALAANQPITYETVQRIYAGQADDELGKRVLSAWAVPYEVDGVTSTSYAYSRTSSTWQDIHAAPVPVLARKGQRSDTTRTVKARALAWEAGASPDGELRLVSSSGGNGTAISVTGTTPTWTSEFEVDVDCEDFTEATGMPGGSWDDIHVEARELGSGTLYVASIAIYE